MRRSDLLKSIYSELGKYQKRFSEKVATTPHYNESHDLLMDIFGITPEQKRLQAQYWGRELGTLWQDLVTDCFRESDQVQRFTGPIVVPDSRGTSYEPADLSGNGYAIDTKYRIGSGDAKFVKSFKESKAMLESKNLKAVLLILREDNLASPIHSAEKSGWVVLTGKGSFSFVERETGIALQSILVENVGKFKI